MTYKPYNGWSQAELDYMADNYRKGFSYTQIAEGLGNGRTRSAVAGALRRLRSGDGRNRAKPREQGVPIDTMRRIDQVAELLSEGFDFAGIAEELNITRKAVVSCFKRIRAGLGRQAA
jgi:hypothetical protein